MTPPDHRSVEHDVSAVADLDTVWRLLTTTDGLASWFGTEAAIELRVGGTYEIGWGGEERIVGEVAELDEGRRLRIVYLHDGDEVGGEEWLLSHADGVTTIRLVHSLPDPGVDDWDGWYGDYRRGWRLFLTSLRYAAELDVAVGRSAASAYVPAPAGRRATWDAIAAAMREQSGPGFGEEIVDPPHQLVLTGPTSTVVGDLEGGGDGLVCYLQVASHGPDRDGDEATRWRDDLLRRLIAVVPG